jgi:hypothetical protein
VTATGDVDVSVGQRPWERRALCRELAVGEVTGAALARKYDVTRQAISAFKKRHAAEIDAIKADLDNEFAGLWIAQKSARIAAYQADLEASEGGGFGSHFEQIRTRTQVLKAVAEELGQLPPRATITIVPVQHILEGVDPSALT